MISYICYILCPHYDIVVLNLQYHSTILHKISYNWKLYSISYTIWWLGVMRYRMLDMPVRYRSVNIGYRIHRISYRKCAYDVVYDIVCYDIVYQPTISYVDIRYPRVPRIQMVRVHPGRPAALPTATVWDEELRARTAGVRLPPRQPGPGTPSHRSGRTVCLIMLRHRYR